MNRIIRAAAFAAIAGLAAGCSDTPMAGPAPSFAKGNLDTDSMAILSWAGTVTVDGLPVTAGIQGDGRDRYGSPVFRKGR